MNDGAAEAELLLKAGRGDEAAFLLLYDRHRTPVFRFACRMLGCATQAEDAPFGVVFQRGAPLESAPGSKVTLPPPFVILEPQPGATFSRAQGLLVRWS